MLRDENDFARKSISASSSNMDFNIFSNEKSISVAWTVTNVNDIFGLKVVKKKRLTIWEYRICVDQEECFAKSRNVWQREYNARK